MPTKLRYGQVQRSAMNWPFFIAAERSLFAEQNLAVEVQVFTSPPDPVAALIDGSLDLINVIPDVALLQMSRGTPLAIIANTNNRPQYRLLAQAEVKECKDLRRRKIGVNDGRSAEALILKKLLNQKGLAAEDYELVPSGPPPKRCEQLQHGLLAATMVTQPFDFLLEEVGFKSLASSSEVVPHYPFTVCVVRREEKINEKAVFFLQSLKEAWEWLANPANRQHAVKILSRSTETPEKQAQATYDLYLNPPTAPNLAPTHQGVATILELLVESGRLLPPLAPPQMFIDERYVKKLEEAL
jgi:ABC-type nitrate/sulfonate/bicarbonate transport system substrate-binding protein